MPAVLKKTKFKIFVSENSIGCVLFGVFTLQFYLIKYKTSLRGIVKKHSFIGRTGQEVMLMKSLMNFFGKKGFSLEHTDLDSLKYFLMILNS